MEYHIFKKKSNKNGKIKWSWYYWYWNAGHTKQVQKACKGCKSKHEAELYIQQLHPQIKVSPLIKDLAASMFVPGSMNFLRRKDRSYCAAIVLLRKSRNWKIASCRASNGD